jgi:glycosyltransferase involved in cell wall biosynthesis
MKIGFDAKRAIQNNTGLGNYSRYVIEVLSEHYSNDYILFAPKEKENSRLQVIRSRKKISFVFPTGFSKLFPSLWRIFGIKKELKKQEIEVFHGLSGELPTGIERAGIKTVVTIHDLIFLRYPEYYKPVDRFIYRIKTTRACKKADKIIAISERTTQDIISFFQIPKEKIEVVYQGYHPKFRLKVSEKKKNGIVVKYQLPPCYLLFVGSIEARKNLLLVIKALKKIPEDVHLVAVGKSTPYQQQIEEYAEKSGVKPRLHILNQVPFEDLPAIYQAAQLFVYPSFFEGFGIPILEALSSDIPVIAANSSCLEEAGGRHSFYINPTDEDELAIRIKNILNDPELAARMVRAGRKYLKRFSRKRIAEQLMQIYKSL